MPLHIKADKDDYAQTVLLVGDPGRAEKIGQILKGAKIVNKNRGLIGYTGMYKDKAVSVQTTGMGCPSAAIVVEELVQLGVKNFIRIGTCGGISKNIKPLDIIAAVAATPLDGTTRTYLDGKPHAPYATFEILKVAHELARQMKVDVHFGGIASVDVFYNPSPDYVSSLRSKGILAVEMETSLIYYLANKYNLRTASFLLVSDIIGGGEEFTVFVSNDDLTKGIEKLIMFVLEVSYQAEIEPAY